MDDRILKQLSFIYEIDKIKEIFRRNKLFNKDRRENDAEHSWHIAVMALVLSEYSNKPVDIGKVIKMLIIHDIVEIDAGDYSAYTSRKQEKLEKETVAAKRIFGILPDNQRDEFIALWTEFETAETSEAKFAAAIDRLVPLLQAFYSGGGNWTEHEITTDRILEVNGKIKHGSQEIWDYVLKQIDLAIEDGYLDEMK